MCTMSTFCRVTIRPGLTGTVPTYNLCPDVPAGLYKPCPGGEREREDEVPISCSVAAVILTVSIDIIYLVHSFCSCYNLNVRRLLWCKGREEVSHNVNTVKI